MLSTRKLPFYTSSQKLEPQSQGDTSIQDVQGEATLSSFRIFSVFFWYFRGPTRGGEFRDFFRIFFVFPGLRGF